MTFWLALQRAAPSGCLVLRLEDLDRERCQPHFRAAVFEDLHWFGCEWQEGPDCAGPYGPYVQSERGAFYLDAWERLRAAGFIYPCTCTRRDVRQAVAAPHAEEDEPHYPGPCRPAKGMVSAAKNPAGVNWRFRVPIGEEIAFVDARCGARHAVAGLDFGDFLVWRKDDIPAYQLAVVVDDAAMRITEVVRGEDLLASTFRQLLLYRALGCEPPAFFHGPLLTDDAGRRLAKRENALSLRALRERGADPGDLRRGILEKLNRGACESRGD